MSKKRALLASAVLSMAAIAASCGGGGGTPPSGGGGGGGGGTGQQPIINPPAVFVGIIQANTGQVSYFVMDHTGTKVPVQNLPINHDNVEIRYQFNNRNLIVRDLNNNKLYCVDVASDLDNPQAIDLQIDITGALDPYGVPLSREYLRNRPFLIVNSANKSFIVRNDCSKANIVNSDVTVISVTNTFAIVESNANNNVYIVRSNGTVMPVGVNYNKVIGDPTSAFILINNASSTAIFVDDTLNFTNLLNFPATPAALGRIQIERVGNNYVVAVEDKAAPTKTIQLYNFPQGSNPPQTPALVSNNLCPAVINNIDAFDLDANGRLYVAVETNAAGTCLGANNVGAGNRVVGVVGPTGSLIGGFDTNSGDPITLLAGTNSGALAFQDVTHDVFYISASNVSNPLIITNDPCVSIDTTTGGPGTINKLTTLANKYNTSAPANVRFMGNRTDNIMIGVLNFGGNKNYVASIDVSNPLNISCRVSEANSSGADAFYLPISLANAFVIEDPGTNALTEQSATSAATKINVDGNDFLPLACGGDLLVQRYNQTQRVCTDGTGTDMIVIDYQADIRKVINNPFITGSIFFGDVSNTTFGGNPVFIGTEIDPFCIARQMGLGIPSPQNLRIGNNNPASLANSNSCFIVPTNPNNPAFRVPLVAE